MYELHDSYMNY